MTSLYKKLKKEAVFELTLESGEKVYMSVNCSNYMNEKRYVVVVDSHKFLNLWQNEPNPLSYDLNFGNKESWKKDKKFIDAENGFSYGVKNPVPLANVVCYVNKKNNKPYIAIDNGITRTIWLLSNNVKFFPVECKNHEESKLLLEYAGYSLSDISSVKNLLSC